MEYIDNQIESNSKLTLGIDFEIELLNNERRNIIEKLRILKLQRDNLVDNNLTLMRFKRNVNPAS